MPDNREYEPIRITPIYMGSTLHLAIFQQLTVGSPPYTWGARKDKFDLAVKHGITPIYMGSTHGSIWRYAVWQDHPHIHGEHMKILKNMWKHLGSPPYTWGARAVNGETNSLLGITPIYMGSTYLPYARMTRRWDHPHIHGEHMKSLKLESRVTGSPPYTWGARRRL